MSSQVPHPRMSFFFISYVRIFFFFKLEISPRLPSSFFLLVYVLGVVSLVSVH